MGRCKLSLLMLAMVVCVSHFTVSECCSNQQKQLIQKITRVSTHEQISELASQQTQPVVVVGYFNSTNSQEYSEFCAAADTLLEYTFMEVIGEDAGRLGLQLDRPYLEMYAKGQNHAVVNRLQIFSTKAIAWWVYANKQSSLRDKVRFSPQGAYVLFINPSQNDSRHFQRVFANASAQNLGKANFFVMDGTKYKKLVEGNNQTLPLLAMLFHRTDEETLYKFYASSKAELSVDSVQQFIDEVEKQLGPRGSVLDIMPTPATSEPESKVLAVDIIRPVLFQNTHNETRQVLGRKPSPFLSDFLICFLSSLLVASAMTCALFNLRKPKNRRPCNRGAKTSTPTSTSTESQELQEPHATQDALVGDNHKSQEVVEEAIHHSAPIREDLPDKIKQFKETVQAIKQKYGETPVSQDVHVTSKHGGM